MAKKLQPATLTELADDFDLEGAAHQGKMLPLQSAQALETALEESPEDLLSRARLLGYYQALQARARGGAVRRCRQMKAKHILWFIEHAPACKFAADLYFQIAPAGDQADFKKVKRAWSSAMANNSNNTQIAVNAACFLIDYESQAARTILRRVLAVDPQNKWVRHLLVHLGANPETTRKLVVRDAKKFDRVSLTKQANELHTAQIVWHAEARPARSAVTLEKLIRKYPYDLSARASLLGHYAARVERHNLLSLDPDASAHLARHLLWVIEHVPGWDLLTSLRHSIRWRRDPMHFPVVKDAWLAQLEKSPDDSAVLANAAYYFMDNNEVRTASELVARVKKLARERQHEMEWLVERRKHKTPAEEMAQAIDNLDHNLIDTLLSTGKGSQRPTRLPSLLAQSQVSRQADDIDLSGAHLEGVYWWIPEESAINLENVLEPDSHDIYNRSKLIGFYQGYNRSYREDTIPPERLAAYLRHVHWFVDNLPECWQTGSVYWSYIHKVDPRAYEKLKDLWLKKFSGDPDNERIAVNCALCLHATDAKPAKKILQAFLARNPSSPLAEELLDRLKAGKKKVDGRTVDKALSDLAFRAGKKNTRLSRMCNQLDPVGCGLFGHKLPAITVISNEKVINANPNDVVLRKEVTGYCFTNYSAAHPLSIDPEVSRILLNHAVWMIAHVPDANHSYLFVHLDHSEDNLSFQIFAAAWAMQVRAYKKNLEIAMNAADALTLGKAREALAILKNARIAHPKNERLEKRIDHVKRFV